MDKKLITITLLFNLCFLILMLASGLHFNFLVHFSFIIITFQSLVFLVLINSLMVKMYFTFCFLFFGTIPYLEHSQEIYSYWGMQSVPAELIFQVNTIILLLNFIVVFTYRFAGKESFENIQNFYSGSFLSESFSSFKLRISTKDNFYLLVLLALMSVLFTLYINDFNLSNLMYRASVTDRVQLDGPVMLIINYIIRPIPAIILIHCLIYQPPSYKLKSTFFLFLCIINIFPTGVPRFYAAAVYLPVLLLTFNQLLLRGRLNVLIIFSIFFVFPFLNNFRRVSESEEISFFSGFDFLYSGHFDTYLSIGQIIQYDFISYGNQLLGSFLFFVPRSIWPDKPTGTGHELASSIGLKFANVSANFYAEGYANFGFLGMFLFAAILGVTMRYFDEKLLRKLLVDEGSDNIIPIYLVFLSFMVFILRGDLLSSVSYFIGFLLCIKMISMHFKVSWSNTTGHFDLR